MAGIFFAVVGASGVGKDSVLSAVRPRLETTNRYFFPQRIITRPEDAGGEEHLSMSNSDFVQAVRDDRFSLWWMAHELHYALPDTVFDKLRRNVHVIANISRRWGINPEEALRGSNSKFARRFRAIERAMKEQDVRLEDATLQQMEDAYQQAKARESS